MAGNFGLSGTMQRVGAPGHTSGTPIVMVAAYSAQVDPFADATVENDPAHLVADLRHVPAGMEEIFTGRQSPA